MKPIYAYDEKFKYIRGEDSEIPDDAEVPEGFTDVQSTLR